jgi:hypothetical protein
MPYQRVTCIGIGNMGAALASTLLKAKSPLTIWNRTANRPQIASLVESGAEFEGNIESAIAKSDDVVILCVLDYDAIYHAFAPLDSSQTSLAGKTVVNLTNGTPREARKAEEWMKAHGAARYFDGGVMVTPQLVGTPHSFVVYSGESEDGFSGVSKLLAPLGAAQYVGPDAGAAAIRDLAALAAMYGMFCGAFTGMGLLKKQKRQAGGEGEEETKVLPAVEKVVVPLLTALVPYVSLLAKSIDEETWDDNMGNPLGMQLAGVKNIIRACEEEGVDGRGLEFLSSVMQKVVDERGGDGGVAVVGKYLLK